VLIASPGPDIAERLRRLGVGPGSRVLDVGCGRGDDVLEVARRVGPEGLAAGVDASAELLSAAAGAALRSGTPAAFVLGETADLPFPDGDFDAVYAAGTLHAATDPAAAVAELVRVTAPGGTVLAVDSRLAPRLPGLFRAAGLEDVRAGGPPLAQAAVAVWGRRPA
jgi:ubiquinone/menaquinone biosynthesis C-methylase UbiE